MKKATHQLIRQISLISGVVIIIMLGYYALLHTRYKHETYHREVAIATSGNQKQVASSSVSLLFVGDMMFDRYIRQVSNKYSADFLFSCIDPLLKKHDIVIGNLEGPITKNPSTSMGTKIGSPENYYFTFPTSTASLLFNHNIKIVNIGNNHIGNQGIEGIIQTKSFLQSSNVGFFGGLVGDELVYRTVEHGIPLSFVSYNQFGGEKEEVVVKRIIEEKASGRMVIVYAHWGEEYKEVVAPVRTTAKLFAESGAAIIIGSHPHIVQSHEVIGSTPVYYSLGNFIFDQYFDESVMKGLALSVTISSGAILSIQEYPLVIKKDGRTCPVD